MSTAPKNRPRSPERVTTAQRRVAAMELRVSGAKFKDIGRTLGVSEQMAARYVQKELERLQAVTTQAAEEIRSMELARLDHYLFTLQPKIDAGDVGAIDRAIRIGERRARLTGCDLQIPIPGANKTAAYLVLPPPARSVEEWLKTINQETGQDKKEE
jgi:hypothetical protein